MTGFLGELRERRVLPAIGVYVASSWVAIEILDRLTERYGLSPYLTDLVFWGLFSLIPAVCILAWAFGYVSCYYVMAGASPGRRRALFLWSRLSDAVS